MKAFSCPNLGYKVWVVSKILNSGRKEILLEGVRALPWRKANPTCQSFGRVSERNYYTNHIKREPTQVILHLTKNPPACLVGNVFLACPTGRWPRNKPRVQLLAGWGTSCGWEEASPQPGVGLVVAGRWVDGLQVDNRWHPSFITKSVISGFTTQKILVYQ